MLTNADAHVKSAVRSWRPPGLVRSRGCCVKTVMFTVDPGEKLDSAFDYACFGHGMRCLHGHIVCTLLFCLTSVAPVLLTGGWILEKGLGVRG